MKVVADEDPKTKNFLEKIGKSVVVFSFLESQLDFQIWELIGARGEVAYDVQRIGKRITAQLSFEMKTKLLTSLITERFGEQRSALFSTVGKRLEKINSERNNIVHALWFIQYGNTAEGILPSTKRISENHSLRKRKNLGRIPDFKESIQETKLSDLDKFNEEMDIVTNELLNFFLPK